MATAGIIAAPQIIPASAIGKGKRPAPSDRIVMAIIGAGSMGTGDLRSLMSDTAVQYVAACDVDRNHREKAVERINEHYGTQGARCYEDFREMFEKESLDAINIAIPDHWHAIITCAAANKGLHMYGQKPLCRYLREGRAIVNTVKKNDVVFQTGSQQRSLPMFIKACNIVKNGDLGKIEKIEIGLPDGKKSGVGMPDVQPVPDGVNWDMWLGPAKKVPFRGVLHWNWRWILDYSGGQLTDWAGHHIDIALWSMGLSHSGPTEIQGVGRALENDLYDTPVAYDINYKFANGLNMRVANVSAYKDRKGGLENRRNGRGNFPGDMGVVWYGEKGWLCVDRSGIWAENPELLKKEYSAKETIYDTMGLNHYQNFIDCVRTGRPNICPAEDGHRSISMGLLGEIAMTTGETLHWDPKKELFINASEKATEMLSPHYRGNWKL